MVYNTLGVLAAARELGVPLADSARVLSHSAHVKGRVEPVPVPGDYTRAHRLRPHPRRPGECAHRRPGLSPGAGWWPSSAAAGTVIRPSGPRWGPSPPAWRTLWWSPPTTPAPRSPGTSSGTSWRGWKTRRRLIVVVEDRAEAIRWAMDHAQPGDVIVLAGKGPRDLPGGQPPEARTWMSGRSWRSISPPVNKSESPAIRRERGKKLWKSLLRVWSALWPTALLGGEGDPARPAAAEGGAGDPGDRPEVARHQGRHPHHGGADVHCRHRHRHSGWRGGRI